MPKMDNEEEGTDFDLKTEMVPGDITIAKDSDDESDMEKGNDRGQWSRHLDFMLSMVGYCVGLGNLWRFPYLCMRNGGGAFLIPFLFFLITCGIPMFFLETSLGQFTSKSALHCWGVSPLFKGIGIGMVVLVAVLNLYYNLIVGWTLYYLGNSFRWPLPWSTCGNWWNTGYCTTDWTSYTNETNVNESLTAILVKNGSWMPEYNTTVNTTAPGNINATSVVSAVEEFWQHNVLQMTGGLDVLGGIPWHLALSFLGAWLLVFLCLMKGVRSVGKVVYVTATLPYILLTVLLVRGLTLKGSLDGVLFYITPDFQKLGEMQVWIEAALQVFYSLGPGWGVLISMSSFNKFNNNCLRDSIIIGFISEGTSIYGGLVVFSILGFMAHESNIPISQVVKSGPGLGFMAYPEAISLLPIPMFWAILFFIMLLTVGLDSQFCCVEMVLTAVMDAFPKLRKRRILVTAMFCAICFLLGLPMICQNGIYIFQLLDWYIGSFAVAIFGFLECIIFGWIYGAERFSRDIELMIGRPVPIVIRICWCIVTPSILLVCIISTIVVYKPPTYGSYVYPDYAEAIGLAVALMSVVPVPIYMVYRVSTAEGSNFRQRLRNSLVPDPNDWVPGTMKYLKGYTSEPIPVSSLRQRIKLNLLGR